MQPLLVFGKFDDTEYDEDDDDDYPNAFLCPITHVRILIMQSTLGLQGWSGEHSGPHMSSTRAEHFPHMTGPIPHARLFYASDQDYLQSDAIRNLHQS